MPNLPKSNPRKGKSFLDQDKYTAELTSGQLVIGVTILLVFGLACFLLGVLVGRFEPTPPVQVASLPPGETEPAQVGRPSTPAGSRFSANEQPEPPAKRQNSIALTPPARSAAATPEGEQTSPRTGILNRNDSPTTPPAAEPPQPRETAGPRPVTLPGQVTPAPRTDPPATEPEPEPQPEPTPEPPAEETAPPEPAPEPEHQPAVTTPEPATTPIEAITPADPEPAPERPSTPAIGARGTYSVQVAALGVRKNAEDLKKAIESATSYQAALADIPNSSLIRVLVGPFPTRQAAQAAQAELQRQVPAVKDTLIRQEQ